MVTHCRTLMLIPTIYGCLLSAMCAQASTPAESAGTNLNSLGEALPTLAVDTPIAVVFQSNESVLNPAMAREYLRAPSIEIGHPRLRLGRLDSSPGLLATYQAASGKRIVFVAAMNPKGQLNAQVLHTNPATGKLERMVNPSKDLGADGKPSREITVDGVNLRAFLKGDAQKTAGYADKEVRIKQFLSADVGDAFLEGLPALYAAVEELKPSAEYATLVAPFGALAMVLQLRAQEFRGFQHAEKVLGAEKAKALRDACDPATDCITRGKTFVIHRSGLFNVLDKQISSVVGQPEPVAIPWNSP